MSKSDSSEIVMAARYSAATIIPLGVAPIIGRLTAPLPHAETAKPKGPELNSNGSAEDIALALAGLAVSIALDFTYNKITPRLGKLGEVISAPRTQRWTLSLMGAGAGILAGIKLSADQPIPTQALWAVKGMFIGAGSAWWFAGIAPNWAGSKRRHILAKAKP